jgi:hypothetical protein
MTGVSTARLARSINISLLPLLGTAAGGRQTHRRGDRCVPRLAPAQVMDAGSVRYRPLMQRNRLSY